MCIRNTNFKQRNTKETRDVGKGTISWTLFVSKMYAHPYELSKIVSYFALLLSHRNLFFFIHLFYKQRTKKNFKLLFRAYGAGIAQSV
jgi:hypothetical protein